jgi:acyl carrier protein
MPRHTIAFAFCTVALTSTVQAHAWSMRHIIHNQNLIHIQADDIAKRIASIVAENLELSSADLSPEMVLKELGADDLNMVEITLELETEFDIIIPDEEMEKVQTVAELNALIEKLDAAKQ